MTVVTERITDVAGGKMGAPVVDKTADRLRNILQFHYRFPRNGADLRVDSWKKKYETWWVNSYGDYCARVADHSWLLKPAEAAQVLAKPDLGPTTSKLVEAAVNSYVPEISAMAVQKRKLSVNHFAVALAHPIFSIFTLLDGEKLEPRRLREYIHWQRKMGMSKDEVREALDAAQRIVAARVVFEIESDGTPSGPARRKWF
jgi:hypothetical protein